MKKLNIFDWMSLFLLIIGGLNWGLVGLLNFDLVATIFGNMSVLSRVIYIVVGTSGVYLSFIVFRLEKN